MISLVLTFESFFREETNLENRYVQMLTGFFNKNTKNQGLASFFKVCIIVMVQKYQRWVNLAPSDGKRDAISENGNIFPLLWFLISKDLESFSE